MEEPGAAGPGGDLGGTLIALIVGDDPIGRIGSLIAIAQGGHALLGWLKQRGVESMLIDDGMAVWLASEAAFKATGSNDMTFNAITKVKPVISDWEEQFEGFLVTFRTEMQLVEVTVSRNGVVGLVVTHDISNWAESDSEAEY